MALPLAAIPILGDLIGKVLDKVAPDKLSPGDRLKIEAEIARAVRSDEGELEDAFRQFILEYEGRAADMPRFIQILRGTVRPVLTYAFSAFFLTIVWAWLMGDITLTGPDVSTAVKLVFACTALTLGFWFGDRLLQRSGLLDVLKRKDGS